MKEYFLDEFKNTEAYTEFVRYMLVHSDIFSLVYFKLRENEKMKKQTKMIFDGLKRFKVHSQKTKKWPGTETMDQVHKYKIVFYRSDMECLECLTQVKDIYDWDYPSAPMDLCFYREGYCWLNVVFSCVEYCDI